MSHHPHEHDDLSRLLHDAVRDVHPQGTPDDVRRRAEEGSTPMNSPDTRPGLRRWLPVSLAAAAAMALVIGGTLWLTNQQGGDNPPTASGDHTGQADPTQPASPQQSPSDGTSAATETASRALPVYYLGDTINGPRLFREFQRAQVCAEDSCAWTAAVKAAVTGSPQDGDYRSGWPASTAGVQWVKYDGDTITVSLSGDLHDRPAGMSPAEAQMAVQQVVFTAQAAVGQGRKPVQLLLDGQHTDSLLGVPTAEPLANDDPDSTLAPVQVYAPAENAEVKTTFTVTGQAAAFEANVQWELVRDGQVVKRGFTMAKECCTLAPYSFVVKDVAPGQYTLMVHDEDASGQGRVNSDTKQISVVG